MKRTRRPPAAEAVMTAPSSSLIKDRYEAGFAHAMRGGQLDRIEYFKLSFREGFRAAKLGMRAMRRKQGLIAFPVQGRMRFKAP